MHCKQVIAYLRIYICSDLQFQQQAFIQVCMPGKDFEPKEILQGDLKSAMQKERGCNEVI